MSESQFNYLFTLKNAHLSSNSYNFWTQRNIAMKFAGYMWPESSSEKKCKFGEKNLLKFQRYRIFLRGLLFLARPVELWSLAFGDWLFLNLWISANIKPKRTVAASRGFLAIARLSCYPYQVKAPSLPAPPHSFFLSTPSPTFPY